MDFAKSSGDDQYILINPSLLVLRQAQEAFSGFAEENNLKSTDDVVNMIKEIRSE